MKSYKYLIIGGGMTADAAVKGIRELDFEGSIGVISAEKDMPYIRPQLSKGLWKGKPIEKIWLHTEKNKVDVHLDRTVATVDANAKRVRDNKGDEYGYEKLLLATGGTPNRLPFGGDDIIYFRTYHDYQRLREVADKHERFLVIGAGFIGSEIAAALNMVGKKVALVFPGSAIGDNVYPAHLAQFINEAYKGKGVELIPGDSISDVEKTSSGYKVTSKNGRSFEVDGVVAGIGIKPNVELAKAIGAKVENGIVVDDRQRTSVADVFAAGDVAQFPNALLGKARRVEHEDNALQMGHQAGRNMAGADEAYTHTPYFYADMFELGYEAVGELSSKLEIVEDWKEKHKTGVVYYLDQGRVRGALLWNVWGKVDQATALIGQPGPFTAKDLIDKISAD